MGTAYGDCSTEPHALRASWTLSDQNGVIAQGDSDKYRRISGLGWGDVSRGIGMFSVGSGKHYLLDVQILEDGSRLNSGTPRLRVEEEGGLYSQYSAWGDSLGGWCLILFLAGLVLLIRRVVLRSREKLERNRISLTSPGPHSFELQISRDPSQPKAIPACSQYFQWAQKLPLQRRFSALPSFSLIAALGLSWLIVFFMISSPFPQRGLLVYLTKPSSAGIVERWAGPIVVYIQDAGFRIPPRVYVNSKLVSWDQLSDGIKAEISRRPEWVIYVKADPNVLFANVANVVSVARSLHARVVLLPGVESEPEPAVKKP